MISELVELDGYPIADQSLRRHPVLRARLPVFGQALSAERSSDGLFLSFFLLTSLLIERGTFRVSVEFRGIPWNFLGKAFAFAVFSLAFFFRGFRGIPWN